MKRRSILLAAMWAGMIAVIVVVRVIGIDASWVSLGLVACPLALQVHDDARALWQGRGTRRQALFNLRIWVLSAQLAILLGALETVSGWTTAFARSDLVLALCLAVLSMGTLAGAWAYARAESIPFRLAFGPLWWIDRWEAGQDERH